MMTEAIEKMMQRLDEKLDEFRKELKEGQDKVAATAARRARQEPRYVFKKKSHEEQSKVNENVDDAIEVLRTGYFPDISVWPAAMFEGSNVQWRLRKSAFRIAVQLRRQLYSKLFAYY